EGDELLELALVFSQALAPLLQRRLLRVGMGIDAGLQEGGRAARGAQGASADRAQGPALAAADQALGHARQTHQDGAASQHLAWPDFALDLNVPAGADRCVVHEARLEGAAA